MKNDVKVQFYFLLINQSINQLIVWILGVTVSLKWRMNEKCATNWHYSLHFMSLHYVPWGSVGVCNIQLWLSDPGVKLKQVNIPLKPTQRPLGHFNSKRHHCNNLTVTYSVSDGEWWAYTDFIQLCGIFHLLYNPPHNPTQTCSCSVFLKCGLLTDYP